MSTEHQLSKKEREAMCRNCKFFSSRKRQPCCVAYFNAVKYYHLQGKCRYWISNQEI